MPSGRDISLKSSDDGIGQVFSNVIKLNDVIRKRPMQLLDDYWEPPAPTPRISEN